MSYVCLKAIRFSIFGFCLIIVTWQSVKCVLKFVEKPLGTQISLVESTKETLPEITVCPYPFGNTGKKFRYNTTILKDCNIGFDDYKTNGKWTGNGSDFCQNPIELQEKLMTSPENLIRDVEINLYTNAGDKEGIYIYPNNSNVWIPNDMRYYGRCYTFKPTAEMKNGGLYKLEITIKTRVRIFERQFLRRPYDIQIKFAD